MPNAYYSNTNQLQSVSSYAGYTYNAIGQMISEVPIAGPQKHLTYDVTGKVKEIKDELGVIQLSFTYDDRGFRLSKKDHETGKVTHYIRDASGSLLSLYDNGTGGTIAQKEVPLYGSGKLGIHYPIDDATSYELSDHLGNVRAVISREKKNGLADVLTYTDYYPFGSVLRSGGVGYRYGYQGEFSEKDEETGWNSFELRNYDPVIGRWLSVDPMRVGFSPYIGMANNPVSSVDPDGGKPLDWYQNNETGELEWINGSAEVEGYTYLGEDLTFSFSSFIDRADWDGPNPWFDVSGEKVFNAVTLDFNQDADGNLLGLANVTYTSQIMTNAGGFTGVSWNSLGNYQIGAGGRGNAMNFTAGFEKHAGVPFVETLGLMAQGYMRVNVAQKLMITGSNGIINYKAYTDVFPSATLHINGVKAMYYRQPSFETHRFWNYTAPNLYERQGISFKRGGY